MASGDCGPMNSALVVAACVWMTGMGTLFAQTIEVLPERVLMDESASIRAHGLQPNEHVLIGAELVDGTGVRWTSQAEFIADADGLVDASKHAPAGGSYKEVSAMGLIWSMMPAGKKEGRYQPPRDFGSQTIELKLIRQGKEVSRAQLVQRMISEGVQRVAVREEGVHGVLFTPDPKNRYPGVLVVGGSEGGVPLREAAWLASHGFVAFALAYFRYDDLPAKLEAIPLEYFQRALTWMTKRPEVAGQRLAVVGGSRGGELALQLGSMFPQIGAVVAYVPANVRYPACCGDNRVPYAWTWTGRPLSFMPLRSMRDPRAAVDAAIEVEKTRGPVLMISGDSDHVWDSSAMADAVIARLKGAHFPFRNENLKYSHAGHGAGRPGIFPAWHGTLTHPVSGRPVDLGGTPKGNAESSIDAASKVLAFLRQEFKGQAP
jgi:dienelactone hydrolase